MRHPFVPLFIPFIGVFVLLTTTFSLPQSDREPDALPASFFASHRQSLLATMSDSSVCILYAAGEHSRNGDVDYQYRQDDDFYYLTGLTEPNAVLLLSSRGITVSDTSGSRLVHEILFLEERNLHTESWTGRRLGPEDAATVLGMECGLPLEQMKRYLGKAVYTAARVYAPLAPAEMKGRLAEQLTIIDGILRSAQGRVDIRNPIHLIHAMRNVKSDGELVLMKKAASLSMDGHRAMMRACRPGAYEYQLQAMFEQTVKAGGAEELAYPCIVGSGPNSVILHYEANRRKMKAGDLVVLDCGAEYHSYACDITRTLPVKGTFTAGQRAIYTIVLEAQKACMRMMKPGVTYSEIQGTASSVIRNGLLKLGIIRDSTDYTKYFMHGIGHTVGMDVHDVMPANTLVAGQVWTVEPGIYIPDNSPGVDGQYRNIGVRIEDEVLITSDGCEQLTTALPREPDEIEHAMMTGSLRTE